MTLDAAAPSIVPPSDAALCTKCIAIANIVRTRARYFNRFGAVDARSHTPTLSSFKSCLSTVKLLMPEYTKRRKLSVVMNLLFPNDRRCRSHKISTSINHPQIHRTWFGGSSFSIDIPCKPCISAPTALSYFRFYVYLFFDYFIFLFFIFLLLPRRLGRD